MKLLTRWQEWRDSRREEHKFHCDLILAPGEFVEIHTRRSATSTRAYRQVIGSRHRFTKVHLAASWEHRNTEFVEEE